jgi:hypothetical protein
MTDLLILKQTFTELKIEPHTGDDTIMLSNGLPNLDNLISSLNQFGFTDNEIDIFSPENNTDDKIIICFSGEFATPYVYFFTQLVCKHYGEENVSIVIRYYNHSACSDSFIYGLQVFNSKYERGDDESRAINPREILDKFELFKALLFEHKNESEKFFKLHGFDLPPLNYVALSAIVKNIEPIYYPD